MKLVIFGSGNIGRGLIPEVFYNSVLEISFIDVNKEVIDRLNSTKSYKISKFKSQDLVISNYKAYNIKENKPEALSIIENADLITTAVGFNNLKFIAEYLNEAKPNKKIDVICFENNVRPASHLSTMVNNENYIFIDATVDRIIPNTNSNSLDILCEPYYNVVIEKNNISNFNNYSNCKVVDQLDDYIKLKLFIVNGLHFIIAVLGHNRKYNKIHLTLKDPEIISKINTLKKIYIETISSTTSISKEYIEQYFDNTLDRFKQEELNDDNVRIARNMILKLSPDNRIIPIYNIINNVQEKEFYKSIIMELYKYNNPNDDDSKIIQESIKIIGINGTIKQYSKIDIK